MYVRKYNRCLCQASKWNSGLVTLNFDLLTPKFIVSCPFHISHLCQFAAKLIHLFSRYYVDKFDDRRTNKRTTLCVVTVQLGWGMKTATSYHDSVLPIRLRLFGHIATFPDSTPAEAVLSQCVEACVGPWHCCYRTGPMRFLARWHKRRHEPGLVGFR